MLTSRTEQSKSSFPWKAAAFGALKFAVEHAAARQAKQQPQ
jgi:hypothetical protein